MPGPEMIVSTAALVAPVGNASRGGDFHLIEEVGARTVLVVGDVTGSGEVAASYADRLCRGLTAIMRRAEDPAELLEDLNRLVHSDAEFDRLATALALILDREQWAASWGFAGHLPPHWIDTGLPVDGATPGLPLGFEPSCGATSAERRPLHSGEGFVLFTDGLEDVRGPGGDRFGSARVTNALSTDLRGAAPDVIVKGLKAAACQFGDGELEDDVCIVAVRVT